MNGYRLLADAVVVVHTLYVAFIALGLLVILLGAIAGWRWVRNPWFRGAHLAAIAIVCVQALAGIMCPLTTLENALRQRAGQRGYPGDFIGHWAHELIFMEAEPWVFTTVYLGVGLITLAGLALAPPRWRRAAAVR
jgi:hypothetical protein